jgi:hypothetical protein
MSRLAGAKASFTRLCADFLQRRVNRLREVEARNSTGQLLEFRIARRRIMGRAVYDVIAKRGGFSVGTITWSNQWNKPSFKPDSEAVFDQTCIAEIYAAMKNLC